MVTGIAGLVAGAMSMAAGEYVSVRSQADTEHADLSRERAELATQPALEKQELASITSRAASKQARRPGRRAADGPRCAGRART